MTAKKSGLAFHCHHDRLYEFVYDYDERVNYIKQNKPADEIELRLRLFKPILEQLIPGRNSKEYAAYGKTWAAYGKKWAAYDKARAACVRKWAAYGKTWAAYHKASVACDKAWAAYDKKYGHEIENLHRKLCPDCTWNGKTIFPDK